MRCDPQIAISDYHWCKKKIFLEGSRSVMEQNMGTVTELGVM